MPQVINTNVSSLNAQRNLNRSQGQLAVSLQRISSGLRINSAKDDAAGLAISNRLTAQIRGLNQASRNAADAISLAQTGEGALQEITNALQRMRELSVQSRNSTNTSADRQSIDAEFQQLLSEVDRIAETTAFNGQNILDGSFGNAAFQVGANVGETISIDVTSSTRADSVGSFASNAYSLINVADQTGASEAAVDALIAAGGTANNAFLNANGDLQLNGVNVTAVAAPATPAGRDQDSAYNIAAAINAETDSHGVTAEATASTIQFTDAQVLGGNVFTDTGSNDTLTYTVKINDVQVISQTEGDATLTAAQIASAVNTESSNTGVTASVDSSGNLTLTAADGRNIKLEETLGGGPSDATDAVVGYFGNTLANGGTSTLHETNLYKGGVTVSSDSAIAVVSNDAQADAFFTGVAHAATDTTNATTLDSANVLTVAKADEAIYKIDQAITDIDLLRGTFGAVQSRFESTIANLQTAAENQSAARSRILDADFAQETASLTRSQILQQAGVSILAQANALPQNVLALLQ